jgi:two-component system, LuxR family, sensor kinase FixL
MFVLFIIDASLTLFRRGGSDAALAFAAISILNTQLMIWSVVRAPVMIALPFLLTLGAIAFELSRDILRAPALARELCESERRLELAASAAGLGLWDWDAAPAPSEPLQ